MSIFGHSLNAKELQVLKGLIEGKQSRQIAQEMGISLSMTNKWREAIRLKFGIRNNNSSHNAIIASVMKKMIIGNVSTTFPIL